MVSGPRFSPRSANDVDVAESLPDINVLALVKGTERYVFLFVDQQSGELLRRLDQFASDPQLSFTWYDAACLKQRVRQMVEGR